MIGDLFLYLLIITSAPILKNVTYPFRIAFDGCRYYISTGDCSIPIEESFQLAWSNESATITLRCMKIASENKRSVV